MSSEIHQPSTEGIHLGIGLHLGGILVPKLTTLHSLPAFWWPETYATYHCPAAPIKHGS